VQRRRRQTRSRSESAAYAIARRRRLTRVVAGLAVVVVVVGVVGAVWLLRGEDKATAYTLQSEIVSRDAPPIPVTADPATYRVVYRVESFGTDTSVSTEELQIRRPFDGHVTFLKDAPPGGDVDQTYAGTLTTSMSATGTNAPDVRPGKPAAAVGDMRLDASLDDLIAQGLFEPRETRHVLDRDCTVYRTGEILQTLNVKAATDTDYVYACIDDAGLLLEEVAVVGNDLVLRVTATDVQLDTELGDDVFTLPGVATPTADGTELTEIPSDSAPAANYWRFAGVPDGYTLRGRYAYRELATAADDSTTTTVEPTTTTTEPAKIETYFDVYANGTRTIIVQQGPVAGAPTVDTAGARTIDAGALGQGSITSSLLGTTVTAQPNDAWFVHINATVPAATLEGFVRTLQVA
jgi:hypothetical protein